MTKQKQLYCAPCTEVLVVQTEEALLAISNNVYGSQGRAGAVLDNGNEYDL